MVSPGMKGCGSFRYRAPARFIGTSGDVVLEYLETGGAELTVSAMGSDRAIGGHRTFQIGRHFLFASLESIRNSHVCVRNAHVDEAIPWEDRNERYRQKISARFRPRRHIGGRHR